MRKIITLVIMLLFLGMTISSSTGLYLNEQSIKPLSSGNILYVGGNGSGNYTKIQDAIDNASDGDTVFVYDDSSPYYENLKVRKSIYLIGEERVTTIIDGGGKGSVVTVKRDGVTISGFTIQNSGTERWNDSGIEAFQRYYCRISNNIIRANPIGMLLFFTYWCNVTNNIIRANPIGLLILCTTRCNVTNNIITSNEVGIIGSGVRMIGECYKNTISENIISNNTNYGIACREGFRYGIFSNNTISHNNYGLEFTCNCYRNICIRNNFSNNLVGLSSIPVGTIVTNNNFINNKRHAKQWFHRNACLVNEGTPDCVFDGNYWGKARRFPYPIPTRYGIIFFCIIPGFPLWDWHPAQEPYDIEV